MTGRETDLIKAGGGLKAVQVPAAASAITAIQAHGEAAGRIRDAAGKQTVLYSAMDKLPWTLAVLVPDGSGGSGAPRVALFAALAAVFAGLAVVALMAYLLRAALAKPLRQLSGAVASIAQGHADVVLPTAARGEIAEVAEALIPMRDSVAAKLEAAKAEKSVLATRLAEIEQLAAETQRRLDEEKVVAEDRAARLADLQQRYDALVAAQNATLEEALPEATAEAGAAEEAAAEQPPA
jgi:methyl-accepting chemotaxis protein